MDMKIKGTWFITELDANDNVISESKFDNLITDAGKQQLRNMFVNGTGRKNWCIVLGVGTLDPVSTNTALTDAISATAKKGTLSIQDNYIQYSVTYASDEYNGTYTEAGVYEDIDMTDEEFEPVLHYLNGTLFNHLKFELPQTKSLVNKLIINVKISFGG